MELDNPYQICIILLIISGIVLLVISLESYFNFKCENPDIEYKFIPRSFQQEQRDPVKASVFFNKMFKESSVNEYGVPLELAAAK